MHGPDPHRPARGQPVLLFLRMAPAWAFVDEVRHFVESFCATASLGDDREAQIALATHELVQNAVAHAVTPTIELRLEVDGDRDRVAIEVSNVCAGGEAERLRGRVTALLAHEPLAAYVQAMRADPRAPGGLGLARLRYESQLEIEVHVEGERVTVRASGRLRPPQLAAEMGVAS